MHARIVPRSSGGTYSIHHCVVTQTDTPDHATVREVIERHLFAGNLPRAAAGEGGDLCAETDLFGPHRHRREQHPRIVGGHALVALPQDLVFDKEAVPAGGFRQCGKLGHRLRVNPAVGESKTVAHEKCSLAPSHTSLN